MTTLIMGDILEGGGQILRIAVSMSALTNTAVLIEKIRYGRKRPGLAAQHLQGVQLVGRQCNATTEGAKIGSTELLFLPGPLRCGFFTADTKTAGNGVSNLTLIGGTNAEMAPQIEYTTRAFLPMLQKFGATFDYNIKRRGFFPAGKGEVTFQIPPVRNLQACQIIDFGHLVEITGEAFFAGKITQTVAENMASAAQTLLRKELNFPARVKVVRFNSEQAFGSGCGLTLIAKTSTGCVLCASKVGRVGLPPDEVGRMVAEELVSTIERRACVDQNMQDQLIVFMALATGTSAVRTGPITLHTETAMHIVRLLSKSEFRIRKDGECNIIECDGVGIINSNYFD